jgi:beta-lactam-binding protein with PASTA domain
MDPSSVTVEVPPKPTKKRLSLIIGIVVGVLIAAGAGVYLFWPGQVIVPDVRGGTLNDALTKLQAAHLSLGRRTVQGDPSQANVVRAQFPAPGTSMASGSTVDLVLGAAAMVQMPALTGKSLNAAERLMSGAGLRVGNIQWNPRARAARGTVLQQAPTAGQLVISGSTVNLSVAGMLQQGTRTNTNSTIAQTTNSYGQNANLSGSWRDRGGAIVRIQQNGTSLQYSAHSAAGNCQGSGVVSGTTFQTSYGCASVIGARTSGRCAGSVAANGHSFSLQCVDSLMGRTNDVFSR